MGLQHVDLGSSEHEMTEATVHRLFQREVVEGVDEVGPVKVRVNAEHLAEDGLADINELNWEAAALSNPVARASQCGKRSVQGSWTSWDGSIGPWCIEATGSKTSRRDGRTIGVLRKGYASWVSREKVGVIYLSGYPSLHEGDVFISRDFNRLLARVQPSE